jgi:signal transduction histidine kinase
MNHQSNGKFDADMVQDVRHRLDEAENGIRATVRELSESQARFEQWDRRRDDALANLAHELKNPINVVSMLIELIERKQEDPSVLREITPRLRHQARRLARLVDDINDLSRVKQGTLAFQDQSVELNGTLKNALESIRVEAHEKQQSVVLRLTSRPLIVRGDPDRIEQILTNILSNATKYTPEGGSIFLESEADAGDAIVRIRDTGCGISAEHLETIFDEFTRIIPSFGDPGGMGIGLGLVKNLVHLHHGTVTARSQGRGKGSEFEVRLPLEPSH